VLLVESGADALRHRHALIDAAGQAIDAQYYIWNRDTAGQLLAERMLAAADRGVRIRLLLDDFTIGGRDPGLAALSSHANASVRVFNPVARRSGIWRGLSLVGDLDRLSRRMHNKALLVDGAVAVIGGRNIGDEYFDLDPELNFRDRDLLAVGPAVEQLEAGFDGYWNHPLSVPIEALAEPADDLDLRRQQLNATVADISLPYDLPQDGLAHFRDRILPGLTWAPVEVLYERPGDAPGEGRDKTPLIIGRLVELVDQARESILIESAYLVLNEAAQEKIATAVERGVEVRAFTNSLASNDVLPNHAGYARHRKEMLEQGLELHEMRPDAIACSAPPPNQPGCGQSEHYGLHAKSAVFDRERLFVGSFNLNPRSAYLNTELVLLIDSPALADQVSTSIEVFMEPDSSWRLGLSDNGQVRWETREAGWTATEPVAGAGRKFTSWLLSRFPFVDDF
jgi:putative cardiolipin synthase